MRVSRLDSTIFMGAPLLLLLAFVSRPMLAKDASTLSREIIGTWVEVGGPERWTFNPDGSVQVKGWRALGAHPASGAYRVLDHETMHFELPIPEQPTLRFLASVSVSGDELVMYSLVFHGGERPKKFRRLKEDARTSQEGKAPREEQVPRSGVALEERRCPFECCVFPMKVTALGTTRFYSDRTETSAVAFTTKKGEEITLLNGVLVTLRAGRAIAIGAGKAWEGAEGSEERVPLKPGQVLELLSYIGEGIYRVRIRNKIYNVDVTESMLRVEREPETLWWFYGKNKSGKAGWSKQADQFEFPIGC